MTNAVTLRLDDDDHAALVHQAALLRVQPGTLARMLVHTGLSDGPESTSDAKAALDRLVTRSRALPNRDAVTLVREARVALGSEG